jgi:NADP-dependent 3-hydroxy acid dehydrogenase YdfG
MAGHTSGKVVWVTGAGSGVGAAAARSAVAAGWSVALTGRREANLRSVAAELDMPDRVGIMPGDVADGASVERARDQVLERFGRIDALVLAAGLNTPKRHWADQRMEEFERIVATNLAGTAATIAAALPELRAHRGVAVIVSSYSAWSFSPMAGVAYAASKSALALLARTLNAEEARSGVRACHLCPGDIATDFLDHRPVVPGPEARAAMLSPRDVADTIQFVLDAPAHVRFDEIVLSPLSQA